MDDVRYSKNKAIIQDAFSHAEVETFTKNEVFNDGLGSRWKFWRRRRNAVLIMIFIGEVSKSIFRTNLSIAVFPMTENYTSINENGTEIQVRDFDWDAKKCGFLLSVFFYGYIATNIPGGILAVKFGGSKLYGLGVVITSVSTLLTPLAARVHFYLLIATRIFEGMCEGILSSCLELLLSRWIPVEERSTSVGVVVTGSLLGHIAGNAVSSAIGSQWGWESIFYCTGSIGVVWFVVWVILVKEYPNLDERMSSCELAFIESSHGRIQLTTYTKVLSIPYLKIITSMPVIAFIIANIASSWAYITYLTHAPAYMKDVLKVNYQKSGYFSTLPYATSFLAAYIITPTADYLTTKNILTHTQVRKIYVCGSLTIIALFCFLIQQVTSAYLVVVILAVITTFITTTHVQLLVNILDIAPRYSSVLAGIEAGTKSLCGMLTPTATGYLTQNKTPEEWHTVFSILSGICLLGALMFGVFASGQLQPWAAEKIPLKPREDEKHQTVLNSTRYQRGPNSMDSQNIK